MDTQLWNGFQTLPNCSHVLFQPINYNLVTGKLSVNFQENVMKWSSFYIKSMKNQLSDDKVEIVP